MNIYKQIYRVIKKYDSIVIARHIGADPDALGSQFGLRELILSSFPNKKVYAVGTQASKFKFFGSNDKIDNVSLSKSLLIVLDTPDLKRIDGAIPTDFEYVIKIDHHPIVDKYADIECIFDDYSSTSQIIIELAYANKLSISKEVGERLYLGVVGDTDRFLHDYTSIRTFELITMMLKDTGIKFTSLYKNLYERPLNEVRFQGYIYQNLCLTENGVAYIKITDKVMKEFGVDSASAGNMINDLKFVNEIIVWIFFSEDIKSNLIRANIRSIGPYVNEVASKYNGGGHIYASGARLKSWEDADKLITDYDKLVKDYKKLN